MEHVGTLDAPAGLAGPNAAIRRSTPSRTSREREERAGRGFPRPPFALLAASSRRFRLCAQTEASGSRSASAAARQGDRLTDRARAPGATLPP